MKDQDTNSVQFLNILQYFVNLSQLDNDIDFSYYYDIVSIMLKRFKTSKNISDKKEILDVLYKLAKLNMDKRKNWLVTHSESYYTIKFISNILRENEVDLKDLNE